MTDQTPQPGTADERIHFGGKEFLRFHPLKRKITDKTVRCFGCGQIDEPDVHESKFCPLAGGWLPFPTSTLTVKLRTDSGFNSTGTQRIALEQWVAIQRILNSEPDFAQSIAANAYPTHLAEIAALRAERDALIAALTPNAVTKRSYMGEFQFSIPDFDDCGGRTMRHVDVPWTTIKEIMAMILEFGTDAPLTTGGQTDA